MTFDPNFFDDFAPGELEALLAEGAADIAEGRVVDGPSVFRELDAMSEARRSNLKRPDSAPRDEKTGY